MRLLPVLLSLVLAAWPLAVMAQRAPVVVELYTSQGCSTCPPADALLADLAQRDGVIGLSLHVDYWDYLGWVDSFGKPRHTARQRGYAKAMHERSLFTPQVIVQGQDRLIGHDAAAISASIAAHAAEPQPVALRAARETGGLRIELAPAGAPVGAALVHVVHFLPGAAVAITGGENAGHEMRYTNVVTDWTTVGEWDGAGPADLRVEGGGDGPLAVIVQQARFGPILAAAQLD